MSEWKGKPYYKERNAKLLQMRLNGATFEEIGKELGLSRQRVHMIWKSLLKESAWEISPKQTYWNDRCVYEKLKDCLNKKGMTMKELVIYVYGEYSPKTYQRLKMHLRGISMFNKTELEKLSELTGICFAEILD